MSDLDTSDSAQLAESRATAARSKALSPLSWDISARIPSELHDCITDYLHDDRSTLSIADLAWLPTLLSQLNSRVLERIVLVVVLASRASLDLLDWPRLAALEGVERVYFSVSINKNWLLASDSIQRVNLESDIVDDRFMINGEPYKYNTT
ncbi:hypothetical protein FB451DRAFT_1395310 [Mycena latifolia]|nr:hypothetical protein FB451DRAFT_1395310 [Mycena latifolia]